MKKRILSVITSIAILCTMMTASIVNVEASNEEVKCVDGSYLTTNDSSVGYTPSRTRGAYLMTGDCSITKAGLSRVYAYASTTANREVKYMATLIYVDQYDEKSDEWGQIYGWAVDSKNDFFLSTAQTVSVDRGYYYRVRARHIAGDEYPYDETASVTNGIYLP